MPVNRGLLRKTGRPASVSSSPTSSLQSHQYKWLLVGRKRDGIFVVRFGSPSAPSGPPGAIELDPHLVGRLALPRRIGRGHCRVIDCNLLAQTPSLNPENRTIWPH